MACGEGKPRRHVWRSSPLIRLASYAAWLFGAIVPALGWWAVAVYGFARFDRGYGRDTWFILQVYLSALTAIAGLVGYTIVAFIRSRSTAPLGALFAGVAFGVCALLAVGVLRRIFPDRDPLPQQFVAALVIGAASAFVAGHRPR
jgi:hypothetical protein